MNWNVFFKNLNLCDIKLKLLYINYRWGKQFFIASIIVKSLRILNGTLTLYTTMANWLSTSHLWSRKVNVCNHIALKRLSSPQNGIKCRGQGPWLCSIDMFDIRRITHHTVLLNTCYWYKNIFCYKYCGPIMILGGFLFTS